MRNIARPKGWVKADAVRVRKNKGRYIVEIRRKAARRRNNSSWPKRPHSQQKWRLAATAYSAEDAKRQAQSIRSYGTPSKVKKLSSKRWAVYMKD